MEKFLVTLGLGLLYMPTQNLECERELKEGETPQEAEIDLQEIKRAVEREHEAS